MVGSGWRHFVARHLFTYLAVLCAAVVLVGAIFGRESLTAAVRNLDPRWLMVALALTLLNYGLRFTKWAAMLADCGIRVPRAANARLYFACLAMVVTPGRLGELYKLVFLRRLHGVPPSRSLAPLIMERVTDALAVLLLVLARLFVGAWAVAAVAVAMLLMVAFGALLAQPAWSARVTRVVVRLPKMTHRGPSIEATLTNYRALLEPRSLSTSLLLSVLGWWAECWGLLCILRGLGVELALGDATWIYATSTLVGNLTFLPGGLGLTEVSLVALLGGIGVGRDLGVGATVLVRAATLWFAVLLGVTVSLVFRRALQWEAVRDEAQIEA